MLSGRGWWDLPIGERCKYGRWEEGKCEKKRPLLGIDPCTRRSQQQGPNHLDTDSCVHISDTFFLLAVCKQIRIVLKQIRDRV
jgi:hypothetical protein